MLFRTMAASALALFLSVALPALARNHGTAPGFEGNEHAANPAQSRMPSPGENNPTLAPVAPIGAEGPLPDAPGKNGTAPGQQALDCSAGFATPAEALMCEIEASQ